MMSVLFACFVSFAGASDVVLVSFDGSATTSHTWKEKNDPVMGGRSTGTFTVEGDVGIFDGEVVDVPFLKAPGFIKAETTDNKVFPDITTCAALALTVRSQTSFAGYRLSFGNAHASGGKFFAYGYKSHFNPPVGRFDTVTVPIKNFTDFWDDATGNPIKTCHDDAQYCPDKETLKNMKTISVWGEGVKGKVHLEIKSIQATGCTSGEVKTMSHHGLGKGRLCPAIPKSKAECPLKNISDQEFEPVCVTRELPAELRERRCMPGHKAPYYKDSQGVFRCACCGAPLWMPSKQFDALPADQWPWPSLHSPPLNGSDGLPAVCHRGPGYGFSTTERNQTIDLGLGAEGEVGCAHCGALLGVFFNSKDEGLDHYCINGVCMTKPGGPLGESCPPTVPGERATVVI